jgi:NAD(P)-dependent dehydrogenase (short-subunit alcohol dehydrogenase family)
MYTVPSQTGQRFIITGANSGTGQEAAKRIAAAGGVVVMAVRTPAKGEAAREAILRETPGADITVEQLDLADLESVRDFADRALASGLPVHALINNAGVMTPPARLLTAQGHELQWGTNFLGPFALTVRLLPLLTTTPGARVVTMTSGMAAMGKIHFEDLDWERKYQAVPAYAQSKLGNMLMGMHLATLAGSRGWDLKSVLAHPGFTNTNLQSAGAQLGSGRPTLMSRMTNGLPIIPSQEVETGTEPLLMAATSPSAANGDFYGPTGRMGLVGEAAKVPLYRSSRGVTLPASLWAVAEAQTGVR